MSDKTRPEQVEYGPTTTTKTAPGGATNTVTRGPRHDYSEGVVTNLRIPVNRAKYSECGDRGPQYVCNRRKDHTGRHAFTHRHACGCVRGVWS